MTVQVFIIYFSFGLSLIMAMGYLVRSFRFRNVVLALLTSELGFLSLFIYLLNSRKIYSFPELFFVQIPVIVSMGPVLYFYVLSLTEDKNKIEKKEWLHFVPSLLAVVFAIVYIIVFNRDDKTVFIGKMLQDNGFILIRGILTSGAAVFLPVIYTAVSVRRIWSRMKRGNPAYRTIMLLLGTIFLWLFMGMMGIVGTITISTPVLELVNYFLSLIIIIFYVLSQKYPYLMLFATVPLKKKSYAKSHLDRVDLTSLRKQLTIIMEEEKLFCDEDLSLARLSDVLGITQHQLSQFLNTYYQQNFNNFLNNYRINEAKKIFLEEPDRQTLSVAFSVGFNSYSAFHAAFKKHTTMSPAQFRRQQEIDHE
ncbi:MAG TPA: AraC family transcriptional regulator [Spirochaetota bacterium]|nr:AraC family transcriptional regulator [Spirochaetota bacterium]